MRKKQLELRVSFLEELNELLLEELSSYEERDKKLINDLSKILPRSSDTMSAMRQREITKFVVDRLERPVV
jgi:hypothetical protein